MPVKFKIGDSVSRKKQYCFDDVQEYANISGDNNPVHLSEEYASQTIFQKPIVHGMLVASQFSAIIASELPGPGSIYLHQTLDFKSPIFHNQVVTVSVRIQDVRLDKPVYKLSTTCKDLDGKILIDGFAVVMKK